MIPAAWYTDPAHWALEQRTLFRQTWIFVGLTMELQGLRHAGVRVADTELVLLLDAQGQPRAYRNVCAHRMARLCEMGEHAGPIRCPYHGWVYDRQGVPVGIPSKASFPQVVAEPERHRLQAVDCAAVGAFVFVRCESGQPVDVHPTPEPSTAGRDLRAWLGSQADFLERASAGFDQVDDAFEAEVEANWKVVMENALEGYHVPAVHAATFLQVDGMDRQAEAPVFFFDDAWHSHLEHAANPDWLRRFARTERQLGQWPWRFEHYTHRLIFPNLTVTSFLGYSFHIQLFHPEAVDRTRVRSRTVGVQFVGSTAAGDKMRRHIYDDGHAFTRRVFAEDGGICRQVQAGLRLAPPHQTAVLGQGIEDRVAHFQRAVKASMAMSVGSSAPISSPPAPMA